RLVASDAALLAVLHPHQQAPPALAPADADSHPILRLASDELTSYFRGATRAFSVPLEPLGTTFQREVWQALRSIPFGEHRSYAWWAKEIGRPRAVRAVGAANGRNPLSIIVPCHRVIGSDGTLTGYAGGLEMKRWLLAHEARTGPGEL